MVRGRVCYASVYTMQPRVAATPYREPSSYYLGTKQRHKVKRTSTTSSLDELMRVRLPRIKLLLKSNSRPKLHWSALRDKFAWTLLKVVESGLFSVLFCETTYFVQQTCPVPGTNLQMSLTTAVQNITSVRKITAVEVPQ